MRALVFSEKDFSIEFLLKGTDGVDHLIRLNIKAVLEETYSSLEENTHHPVGDDALKKLRTYIDERWA
jgi:hypothetical protein